jgi:hypothetical protein
VILPILFGARGVMVLKLDLAGRPYPLRNSRKTERGAGQFLVRLVVRAAPFALELAIDQEPTL